MLLHSEKRKEKDLVE